MNTFPLELPKSDLRIIDDDNKDDEDNDHHSYLKVNKEADDDGMQAIKALRRASLALISKKN